MKKNFSEILIFILAATFFVSLFIIPRDWWNQQIYPSRGTMIEVMVPTGLNASQIAGLFEEAGLVSDGKRLSYWMQKYGIDRRLRPGKYVLKSGSPWEVARQMTRSVPERDRVTIIPGSLFNDIASAVEDKEGLFAALDDESNFPSALKGIMNANPLERAVYMLPDTYFIQRDEPDQLVRRSVGEWWDRVGCEISRQGNLENLENLSIVASLVEKEARFDSERSIIAGVIYNRLQRKMPLQIDATVVYAWGLAGERLNRVLYRHLEIDSPFNTYRYQGLPPGAICVPSYHSWMSAIHPDEHSYLYYVADSSGKHHFSKTFDEHRKAIRKVREAED